MSAFLYGFNPPFIGGQNTVLSRQEDAQLIKNDLLQLLLTIPGERAYRPSFGTTLRSSIMEPMDETTLNMLKNSISQAIREHDPRVSVTRLELKQVGDTNQLNIILVATLVRNPEITITIDRLIGA